jgi:lysophospholipase L1-like esterase
VNAIVAADYNGTTIPPRVGGGTYTVTGGPALTTYPIAPKSVGTVEVMGDSIAAGRNNSGLAGAGWRREVARIVNGTRHMTFNGQFQPTDPATVLDFSPSHTAVGGEGLGATPGAGVTRLSSVATDRGITIGPDGVTILAYGTNDIYRRVVELAQSPATCVTNMAADWASEISGLRVARTGPIEICSVLRVATGSSTANQRSAIDLWNSGLAANVASWNATYGKVYLCDYTQDATPTQGDADNAAVLYDGTHPTPATYTAMANRIASALVSL